jgi:hypothetical protein
MTELSKSYLSVNYALRPAKQVERRMLIDGLLLLSEAGFPIRDYRYTGMGSIHFVDFALFHKFLGIEKMLSIEASPEIQKRVHFNAPYRQLIQVETGHPIGDYISDLSHDEKHVLWLDYDNVLSRGMLQDISLAGSSLSRQSILFVTVDTEPPIGIGDRKKDTKENLLLSRDYFERIAKEYLGLLTDDDFGYELLPRINIRAILGAFQAGKVGRTEEVFIPLFSFLYADGHRMLTIGGMLGTKSDRRVVRRSRFARMDYARLSFTQSPYSIVVPTLTRKEHLYLESHMPCTDNWTPKDFELSSEEVAQYRKIYRFFPCYAELVL